MENVREAYQLSLYIAGKTLQSSTALDNLRKICAERLKGNCRIEVIDLLENPHLARVDQILAIPTLVRTKPPPIRKVIGDLSDANQVLVGLDLR